MKRFLLAVVAATAVLTAIVAPAALGGSQPDPRPGDKQLGTVGGIAYVSDTVTSTNPNYVESDATCPKLGQGWRIAGGGVKLGYKDGALSASRPLDIYLSFGDDDEFLDDFWEASGHAPVGKKLSSFAICMKQPKLKYVRVDQPDDLSLSRTHVDSCPGKTRPTGGGGFIATTNSYLSSIFPSGKDKWGVGLLDANGGTGGMTSDFVCLKAKPKPKKISKRITIPTMKTKAAKASCPADMHVTGGGAKFAGAAGEGKLLSSYPVDGKDADKIPDDGWKVQGNNVSAVSQDLTAYAICMK